MASFRDLEAMFIGEIFAISIDCFLVFFAPYIANPLEEEQGENIAFPVSAVHRAAAQDVGGFP
jgi:hypothetical protein